MKNTILKGVVTFMLASFLFACDNTTSQSASGNSTSQVKTFEDMLDEVSNHNITFKTDYHIYYYEKGKKDTTMEDLNHYQVISKMNQDVYEMVAYIYGTTDVASSSYLVKDDNGKVAQKFLNIQNEVQIVEALDADYASIDWDDSVYINQISKFKTSDFNLENKQYTFSGDLNNLPLTLVHTAIPVSEFDLESFKITTKDDKINSFVFQEKENDEIYASTGHVYGRYLTVSFENIGTTEVTEIKPFEISENNVPLKNALNEMQKATNYTITVDLITSTETINVSQTMVTETDILQISEAEESQGIHTYNGSLYSFSTVNDKLLGVAIPDEEISSLKPSFDFSGDILTYVSSNEGFEIYKVNTLMEEVINYIDFGMEYIDIYSQESGILFYVKDNHLSHIEIPSSTYINGTFSSVTLKVSYASFNSTSIDEIIWDKFVIELEGKNSWSEIELSLNFPDETSMDFTFDMILELTLGDSEAIPFILPSNLVFDVSGEILDTEDQVQVLFEAETTSIEDDLAEIFLILSDAGFEYATEDESTELYTKDNISIYVTAFGEILMIEFDLPVGELI